MHIELHPFYDYFVNKYANDHQKKTKVPMSNCITGF